MYMYSMVHANNNLPLDLHYVYMDVCLSKLNLISTYGWTHNTYSLHDRVVKKGVSFLRGNVSIITSSDLSDMHVISMNVILPPRRREG